MPYRVVDVARRIVATSTIVCLARSLISHSFTQKEKSSLSSAYTSADNVILLRAFAAERRR